MGAFAAVTLLSVLTGFVVVRLSRAALRARLRDRAAQARLAAAKRQAEIRAQNAQAAAKSKGDLLAVMSHEMRTPMSGVLGFANLLLDTPLNQEQREFAQIVQRSGDALLTVINDVLDYSKIEAGRMTVEKIDMALPDVCEGVRAILQSAALERGVALLVRYDPRLPKFIKGDPVRIRQVLLNLAGNAVKFTEGGSVVIGAEALDPAHVKISVTDTGIGIPAEQMATLFQQYAQGDTVEEPPLRRHRARPRDQQDSGRTHGRGDRCAEHLGCRLDVLVRIAAQCRRRSGGARAAAAGSRTGPHPDHAVRGADRSSGADSAGGA